MNTKINIKKFRKDNGLGQKDLMQLFGCGQPNISAIEKESKALEPHQWKALVEKYGEDVLTPYLIRGDKVMSINQRLKKIQEDFCNDSTEEFAEKLGISADAVSGYISGEQAVTAGVWWSLCAKFPQLNKKWIMEGEGEMLKSEQSGASGASVKFHSPEDAPYEKRLIPLYSESTTMGGSGDLIPGTTNDYVEEWIEPGTWFKGATAAIRHYGDSMIEFPQGCILPLKEVQDRRLIVPGKNYVIETSEYRVTKKIQHSDAEKLRVRSTNEEKYEDGTLIYPPFDIEWELVYRIFEVVGYVVKEGSGTLVRMVN